MTELADALEMVAFVSSTPDDEPLFMSDYPEWAFIDMDGGWSYIRREYYPAIQQLIVDMHEAHARTEAALDRAVTVVNEALNLDGTRFKFTYLDFVEDNLAPEAPTPEAE